jgi:hypothetical protein
MFDKHFVEELTKAQVPRLKELFDQYVAEERARIPQGYMTREQAGAFIGGNANTIRYLLEQKEIREYGKGKEKRISKAELDRYLQENPHFNESYGSTRKNGNGKKSEKSDDTVLSALSDMLPPLPVCIFEAVAEMIAAGATPDEARADYMEFRHSMLLRAVKDPGDNAVWGYINAVLETHKADMAIEQSIVEEFGIEWNPPKEYPEIERAIIADLARSPQK